MRNILLLSLSLAACTIDGPAETSIAAPAVDRTALPTAALASDDTHALALKRCDATGGHLPTVLELQQMLGECVRSSIGWICAPASEDGLGKAWTADSCDGGHYVVDFDDGSITCAKERCPSVQSYCIN